MGRLPGLALLLLVERIAPEEMCAAAGKRKEVALCAPAPSRCVRPKSVFWLYIRQVAGFSVGKGVLDALYPAKHIAWGDGYSLAHERTAKQLADAAAAGGVALTGLRHPVDRVVAQYFQTADLEKRTFLELGEWVATHSRTPPRRGHDGRTKLWIELDNAQTKILSGWDGGAPDCADGPGCFGGVDESSLERAKAAIRDKFDRALVVEWLDTPQSVDWLSQLFCFEADAAGVVIRHIRPSYARADDAAKPVPDLRRARPALKGRGAREKAAFRAARRENASWWRAERSVLADIDARNQLDLRLWTWAAGEFRNAVAASWGSHRRPPPPLPPLPCVDAGAHCWSSDAHPPVRDLAVLQ